MTKLLYRIGIPTPAVDMSMEPQDNKWAEV
jgi:hypothetical protein